MKSQIKISLLLVFFGFLAKPSYGFHLGIGFSSAYSGRVVPALNIGMELTPGWLVSGMTAGVSSKAYYHNAYTLSVLRWVKYGSLFFGELWAGFGGGVIYSQKAFIEDQSDEPEETVDSDFMIGPSLRISYYVTKHIYYSLEYVMGLGFAILGNGWGDTGIFSIGFDI